MVGTSFFKKTIKTVPIDGATVLLRADYNVPLHDDGTIADDFRISSSLPTLRYLIERKCKIIICSHLGRPEGKVNLVESLEPVATHLSGLLGKDVAFVPDCVGDQVKQAVKQLKASEIILLENLRFHAEEELNSEEFAQKLANDSGAEYFVQDGFGVVHRAHASTDMITRYLPSVSGLLLEKEYTIITSVMQQPKRPMVAILGGAKISDKIGVIEKFVSIADTVLIGGAMANTFLKYKGHDIGKSVYEDRLEGVIEKIYDAVAKKNEAADEFIVLPRDVAVATSVKSDSRRMVVSVSEVSKDELILDVGPETIQQFVSIIQDASTVVWNGTLGLAEQSKYSYGSARVALTLASQPDTTSVVGGGDTAEFVLKWDSRNGESFTHVSTGGGASLELMAGKKMPGITALLDA